MKQKMLIYWAFLGIFAIGGVALGSSPLDFAEQEGAPVPEIGVLTATNSVEWDMVSRGIDEIGVRFKADDVLPSSAVIRWKGGEHYYFQRLDLSGATVGNWVDCSFSLEGLEEGGWGGGGRTEEDFEQDLRQFQEVEVQVCRRGMGAQRYEVEGFYRAKDGAVVTRDIFTVTFVWHEGSSEKEWEYGAVPEQPEVPEEGRRYVESGVIHTFAGWTPAVSAVTDDATYTATYDEAAVVAQIAGGEVYPSLAEAVAAAEDGATVVLLADQTLDTRIEPNLGADTSLVIDLNEHTLARAGTSGNGSVFDVKSGDVVITNGVIDCTQDDTAIVADGVYAITVRGGANVTLADLDVTVDSKNGACAYPFAGATLAIGSGTYANITDQPYDYKDGWMGMAVNQANVAETLITITGGSFSQVDPKLGDDSAAEGAMSFVDADYWSVEENGAWKVVERIDIAGATVMVADDLVYDGAEKAGVASVTYAGTELVADTDYTVEYADNIAAGDGLATATLTGIGLYKGTTAATFSIAQKPVTITVADASKVYNEADPAFTGTVDGLVNANDLGEITYSRTGSEEDVGTYDDVLTASYTANANYAVTVVPGDFAITAKAATITVADASKVYGEADPAFTGTVEGLVNANDLGEIAYSRTGADEDVGTYDDVLTASYTANANYAVTVVPGDFAITAKAATITVADASKVYGATDPVFTGTVEGLVNANDLGEITYSRTGNDEDVGTYDDVLTASYTANNNYTVAIVAGDFTITPAAVTVTADDATKTAGNADPAFTATVTGLLDASDSIAYSFAREEGEAVGTYAITPQGEQFQGNYEVTYVAGILTITGAIAMDSEGVYYGSLREAIEGAPAGGTVTLLADDEISFAEGGIVIDKDIVIDGDGHTIRGISEDGSANVATPADISSDNVHGFYVTAGDVTIRNVALTEFGDTDYLNKFGFVPVLTSTDYSGDLVLENVDIDQFNRQAICVFGGTLTVTGGTISANAEGKGVDSGSDYFQQPIEVRGGTATIEDVTISGGGSNVGYSGGAVVVFPQASATLVDVDIDFDGIGVWADAADVTVDGDETSIVATDKALFAEEAGLVTLEAGDISGELGVDADENSAIVIHGGTFDRPVPAEFVGDGLTPTRLPDENGKYGVRTAHTVTFDANGGTAVEAVVVADGEPVLAPDPAPAMTNCVLRAWQLDGADYDFATPVTADIELVADWTVAGQTVVFIPNGEGAECPVETLWFEVGDTYTNFLPATWGLEHTFAGWYDAQEGGHRIKMGMEVTAEPLLTLWARWNGPRQTITFDPNGGTCSKLVGHCFLDANYSGFKVPVRGDFEFLGWYDTLVGGTRVLMGDPVTQEYERTLYAHWGQILRFDPNGGTCKLSSRKAVVGETYKALTSASREGYKFLGWYDAQVGGNRVRIGDVVSEQAELTLYAHWSRLQTVIFNVNDNGAGATCSKASVKCYVGETYSGFVIPAWAEHKFLGWYADDEDGRRVRIGDEVTDASERTLYAHWEGPSQMVYFDPNGGTAKKKSMKCFVGETYSSLATATWEGHKFLGWYDAKEGGTRVRIGDEVTADAERTLYAHWKESAGTLSISGFSRSVRAGTLARDAKFDADEYTLSFETEAGVTYEVQWTPELGGEWVTLKTWTAEEDGETSVTVTVPAGSPTGFFRLGAPEAE